MAKVLASDAPVKSKSQQLKQMLKVEPTNPAVWQQLLHCYLRHYGPCLTAPDQLQKMLGPLKYATQNLPRSVPELAEIAAEIWIRYAALSRYAGVEDARAIYRRVEDQQLAAGWASLYTTWAELEHFAGQPEEARRLLRLGREREAKPYSLLLVTGTRLNSAPPSPDTGPPPYEATIEPPFRAWHGEAPPPRRTPLKELPANVAVTPEGKAAAAAKPGAGTSPPPQLALERPPQPTMVIRAGPAPTPAPTPASAGAGAAAFGPGPSPCLRAQPPYSAFVPEAARTAPDSPGPPAKRARSQAAGLSAHHTHTPDPVTGPRLLAEPAAAHSGQNVTPQCQPTPSAGNSSPISPCSPVPFAADRTVQINGVPYTVLCQVGRGGTSEVFKALNSQFELVALKKVNLRQMDPRARNSVVLEVELLKRFQKHPRIVELLDYELIPDQHIHMVLELGEIDLQALLNQHKVRCPETHKLTWVPINENEIRHYWQQMLEAVRAIHDERVVHMDLKPANFLLVKARLKLIDFGIADRLVVNANGDTTDALRAWGVGTMNYISPEALRARDDTLAFDGNKVKVGRPADVWSLGIILYQLVCGFTPFSNFSNIQRSIVIPDSRYPIPFPACSNLDLLNVVQLCLQRDPRARPTIPELLQHPFLHPGRLSERILR